ncbi:SCO family protein [Thiolapillus sp.]
MQTKGVICLLGLLLFLVPAHAATGGDFSLTDQHGKPFQLQQLRGKVVLLFFGYTSCPDVCPTELAGISRVLKLLKADAAKVQGVFVSVDPGRDSPKVLAEYVRYFDESLIGLTGSPSEIETVAKQYQVSYSKHPNPGGGYAMDHTANLYVIDPNGKLFAIVPYGFPPEHVVDVVKEILTNPAGKDL